MSSSSSSSPPPTFLILGGVAQGTASALLTYLWDYDGSSSSSSSSSSVGSLLSGSKKQRRASYIRLVDKFLIIPQSDVFLKYVEGTARKLLKDHHPGSGKASGTGPSAAATANAGIEYLQANLANDEARQKVFVAPGGKAFDVVIDLTPGDASVTGSDEVLIEVAKLARLCGLEALKNGGVKAYIRQADPFITMPSKKCPLKETDADVRPTTQWTKWSLEGTRALAAIPDLPLVVARIANPWGPGVLVGFTRRMVIASIYKFLGGSETMELLWGKDLVLEHVHAHDLAAAYYALAMWQLKTAGSRARANELAGAPLPPCRPAAIPSGADDDSGSSGQDAARWDAKEVEGLLPRESTQRAPVFNVSDASAQTQEELGRVLEKALGIRVEYHSAITNALARMNMGEVEELADERHAEPFLAMCAGSNPPIANSPFSHTLPPPILRKNRCHMDTSKIRDLTGWKPKYGKITVDEVKKVIDGFKKDGVWPNAPSRKGK